MAQSRSLDQMSRRRLVGSLLGLAALGQSSRATATPQTEIEEEPGLRQLARARGVDFGASAVSTGLRSDPVMAAIYARETTIIVADFEMKWTFVRPAPATYAYDRADDLVNFAHDHGLSMRGHCLAWEESNPGWMAPTINQNNAENYLVDHIQKIVSRYAARVQSWDVVNEPIWADHGKPGGLRDGIWLRTLGPRYIDIAFAAARAADPNAMLVLNEAATEVTSAAGLRTRKHFLELLDRLKNDRVPVDAVGLECHLSTRSPFDRDDFGTILRTISRPYRIAASRF
jgi:endo-1,4-beta-xylanase